MRLRFCIAGWVELVGVKMRRKRELKELDLQIALLLITHFGRFKRLVDRKIRSDVWWYESIKMERGIVFGEKCITFADAT